MNERITLISLFSIKDLNKIDNVIKNVTEPLCKVPFIENIDDRASIDTLPYHFTLSAWNIKEKDCILKKLSNIKFNNFKITISDIEIMNGRENSYVLYFKIKENRELKQLQEKVYNILPVEKYNPNKIFENKNKIQEYTNETKVDTVQNKTVTMVEYKENILKKIWNKILSFFNK